ncbi:MAG: YARHG domain-containing protein, partial [Clostridiales bacterium]|nr:YARHG domain-containing protein [Clostridiales bacterium]
YTGIGGYDLNCRHTGYVSLSELTEELIRTEYNFNAYDCSVDESSYSTDTDTNSTDETAETAESSSESDSEYLCSYSSERLITDADMETLSTGDYGELPGGRSLAQMMINEIYARNGCQFESEDVQEYFDGKSWYQEIGTYETDKDAIYNAMSQIEKDNIDYLKSL